MLNIIEGKWFKENHLTVHDFYIPLLNILFDDRLGYHHETFTTKESFEKAIVSAFDSKNKNMIYIGCHGLPDGLQTYRDGMISVDLLIEYINKSKRKTKRGLYIGSCFFGNKENIEKILNQCPQILWVAGYGRSADWIDSTLLEVFFMKQYFVHPKKYDQDLKGLLSHIMREIKNIQGISDSMEFRLYQKIKNDIIEHKLI